MTEFRIRMTNPSYYCTSFTIEEIIGYQPQSPKLKDILTAHDIFNMVVNGCIVTIYPKEYGTV
jgi:hypothetical protein